VIAKVAEELFEVDLVAIYMLIRSKTNFWTGMVEYSRVWISVQSTQPQVDLNSI